jgi:GNAT superfamily N-acetyltransferase
MNLEVKQEAPAFLGEYATIPIAFEVALVFDVVDSTQRPGEFTLTKRHLEVPYRKDYDLVPAEHPLTWAGRFDLSKWGLFAARLKRRLVGGAAIAINDPGLEMAQGRRELAVLWDLRVSPGYRGQGIGSVLFRAAEQWAIARGGRQLKIETQNTNVPACEFYARQGCRLETVRRLVYPDFPHEAQLFWHKELGAKRSSSR